MGFHETKDCRRKHPFIIKFSFEFYLCVNVNKNELMISLDNKIHHQTTDGAG